MFYLYHKELNNLMVELSLEFDEIVDSVQFVIQNTWQGYNTEKISPELKEAVSQVLVALENLKTLNDSSNPIDDILATDSQLHVSELQWQPPVITDLMAALDAILSKAEQDISDAEKSKLGTKNNTGFLHAWQDALAPLRQAGLLERNFMTDLAPIIRQEVKETYQAVEQQIKIKGQNETQYWAKDMMNALTVHIINIRDGRVLESEAQASFDALIKVVMAIASLALKPLLWRQVSG